MQMAEIVFEKLQRYLSVGLVVGLLPALTLPVAGSLMTDAPAIWPVATLLYNLGLWGFFAADSCSRRKILAYAVFATILFLVDSVFFFSYYLQDAGFNEAFFYHIRPDLVHAGVREHLPILAVTTVILAVFLFLSTSALRRVSFKSHRLTPFALALLAVGLFISPPVQSLALYIQNHYCPVNS